MKKIFLLLLPLVSCLGFSQIKIKDPLPTHGIFQEKKDFKAAEYPGGLMALRRAVSEKINTTKIKRAKGTFFSKAKFTVNSNGNIENIVVTGDNVDLNFEIERVIKSLKTKWKPAESNGVPVNSDYSFPTTLTFD